MLRILPSQPSQIHFTSLSANRIQTILNYERCFVLYIIETNILATEIDGKQITFQINNSDPFGRVMQGQDPLIINDVSKEKDFVHFLL